MTAPLRRTVLLLSLILIVLVLAWGGSVVYWHVRLSSALRRFEESMAAGGPADPASTNLLYTAGCRSLPHLVHSLSESKDRNLLNIEMVLVANKAGLQLRGATDIPGTRDWLIDREDSPALVREKIRRVRGWWKSEGGEYHQFWRTWSSACRPLRPN